MNAKTITQIIESSQGSLSCELFPPKAGQPLDDAFAVVEATAKLKPAFISITNGASGSTGSHTVEVAEATQRCGIPALAHLVCMGNSRADIDDTLGRLEKAGIRNVLALRGDVPPGGVQTGDFRYANQLMCHIEARGGFCVGGACYPEAHPEAPSIDSDLDALKRKADSGCAFLTTQMFFDNSVLYSFASRLLKKGVTIPVLPAIMPVTNVKQFGRIVKLSGTSIPPRLRVILDKFQDNPEAMLQAGIAYATWQILDLVANGITHVHLYAMNRPDIAGRIMANLSELFPCA
ncbi:MAG: methylenetetrahydrofolate reductase [Bacillota bacterium]|mgnify:CR=1 FL=1|nr:methylenetetrahydrofolate reductase [Bacillota bacterium]